MDEVELFQNGHSVGKQKKDFVWHLTLVEGDNILKARGTKGTLIKEHGFTVIFVITSYSIHYTKLYESGNEK